MEKTFYYSELPLTFQADCYKTVMVNIIELGSILNKDPFTFLKSKEAQESMNSLRKQIEEYPPSPEDKIINIEGSDELFVHTIIALRFIGDNHEVNFWFWSKRDLVSEAVSKNLTL
ncbi:hypothetical protein Leef1_30 [Polaribacter phage Leef_1]|jgi:hypothetical protein|uniref:Uncharacterized protein n=1 Tax=Polaribacter phage Leef_1 TaxID=2745684 RepID=A0A8E4ZFW1_9CAUD|nr:hypothetical protein M1M28_gp30 [Polaribacter phage Leef_1]QQV91395.1 hypothetical protein Leef1_30 [Polaribacter phage Leef_1]